MVKSRDPGLVPRTHKVVQHQKEDLTDPLLVLPLASVISAQECGTHTPRQVYKYAHTNEQERWLRGTLLLQRTEATSGSL